MKNHGTNKLEGEDNGTLQKWRRQKKSTGKERSGLMVQEKRNHGIKKISEEESAY